MTIRPCVYPGCRDTDGNPRLTSDTTCDPCRSRYRKLLDWLAIDYLTLRQMPTPAKREADGSKHQSAKAKSFGHPNEWASDTLRELSQALNMAEDGLRTHLQHQPAVHWCASEQVLVAHAHKYLTVQFDRLCDYPDAAPTAHVLADLHRQIRGRLGHSRLVQLLPTPCPWCETEALARSVGQIDCRECGKVITEAHYDWFIALTLDAIIDAYDARDTDTLALPASQCEHESTDRVVSEPSHQSR